MIIEYFYRKEGKILMKKNTLKIAAVLSGLAVCLTAFAACSSEKNEDKLIYKEGGKNGAYKSALKDLKLKVLEPIEGFDYGKSLAWDNILLNINNQMLINEYNRLLRRGELTK